MRQVLKMECTYKYFYMPNGGYWESSIMNICIDRCPPNGRYLIPYSCPVISSKVGPVDKASVSGPLSTILPIEAAMVSRYADLVELSQTILWALMLEIISVILPTVAMSVEVPQPSRVGSGILMQVAILAKPQGGIEGHTTTNALVGGNVHTVGAPGEQIGSWVGTM